MVAYVCVACAYSYIYKCVCTSPTLIFFCHVNRRSSNVIKRKKEGKKRKKKMEKEKRKREKKARNSFTDEEKYIGVYACMCVCVYVTLARVDILEFLRMNIERSIFAITPTRSFINLSLSERKKRGGDATKAGSV